MSDAFASEFEELFRGAYRAAVRRVRDKRDRLAPETVALLDHLAGKGLLTRDRDPADARRGLIWLTDEGQAALLEARTVLDPAILASAAAGLTADQRRALIETLRALVVQLRGDAR